MGKNLKQENALTLYGWKQRFENFLSVVSQLCGKIQTFTQQSRTWDAKKLQKSDLKISSLWFPSSVVKFKHLRNKAAVSQLQKNQPTNRCLASDFFKQILKS